MSARSADFPDPLVGLVIDLLEVGHQCHDAIPQVGRVGPRCGARGKRPLVIRHRHQAEIVRELRFQFEPACFPDSPPTTGALSREAGVHRRCYRICMWSRVAGDRAKKPVAPSERFLRVACEQQGIQSEGCVAQPAEAVVPVARTADPFRQRSGRSGDDKLADAATGHANSMIRGRYCGAYGGWLRGIWESPFPYSPNTIYEIGATPG
jgi:hypothetical protein